MSPLTSPSPLHFVVLERQLLKSRSAAGFAPRDRYPFPLHIPATPLRLASEDANTSPLTCG